MLNCNNCNTWCLAAEYVCSRCSIYYSGRPVRVYFCALSFVPQFLCPYIQILVLLFYEYLLMIFTYYRIQSILKYLYKNGELKLRQYWLSRKVLCQIPWNLSLILKFAFAFWFLWNERREKISDLNSFLTFSMANSFKFL